MVKKLFALASISALTGIVVTSAVSGCSSTTTVADSTDAATATDSSKPVIPKDAAPDDAATTPTTCPTSTVVTAADIEAQAKWAPPLPPQNACTQANIDALKAKLAADKAAGKSGTLYTDIQTALGATCVKCAFGPDTAANWQPYVETNSGGTAGFISNRFGSCLAQVESAACGKAYFEFDYCLAKIACNATDCTTAAAVTACQKTAGGKGGACFALGQAFATACPNYATQLDAAGVCGNSPASIAASCASFPDGGSAVDASL